MSSHFNVFGLIFGHECHLYALHTTYGSRGLDHGCGWETSLNPLTMVKGGKKKLNPQTYHIYLKHHEQVLKSPHNTMDGSQDLSYNQIMKTSAL